MKTQRMIGTDTATAAVNKKHCTDRLQEGAVPPPKKEQLVVSVEHVRERKTSTHRAATGAASKQECRSCRQEGAIPPPKKEQLVGQYPQNEQLIVSVAHIRERKNRTVRTEQLQEQRASSNAETAGRKGQYSLRRKSNSSYQ